MTDSDKPDDLDRPIYTPILDANTRPRDQREAGLKFSFTISEDDRRRLDAQAEKLKAMVDVKARPQPDYIYPHKCKHDFAVPHDRTTTREQYKAARTIARAFPYLRSLLQPAIDRLVGTGVRWEEAILRLPPGTTPYRRKQLIEKALFLGQTTPVSSVDCLEEIVTQERADWSAGRMDPTLEAAPFNDYAKRLGHLGPHPMPCCYSPSHAEGLHRPGCPTLYSPLPSLPPLSPPNLP